MKTKTKVLWILLAAGFAGIAVTMGYIMGSDALMSREAEKTWAVAQPFDTVELDTSQAQVIVLPAEGGETRVEAYAKAWLPEEIDMDSIVSVAVRDGALTVTETPFPDEFFGLFPQPCELILRVYVPQDVYDHMTGDAL
jgi:hypothetical protein